MPHTLTEDLESFCIDPHGDMCLCRRNFKKVNKYQLVEYLGVLPSK